MKATRAGAARLLRLCGAGALLLLGGCAGLPMGGDGGPGHRVDLAAIPNAVPRVEPRSPYGNPSSYVVFGRRYHVLRSSRGFVQRGIASWYGTKFHGRRTASGEPYDMYAMTAAHRTLPIPTFIRVTNLRNGRSVVVRVNDRGPFARNRVLDLSWAAAAKLGMLPEGTAPVEIRAIDPRRRKPPVTVASQGSHDPNAAAGTHVPPAHAPDAAGRRAPAANASMHPRQFLQAGAFAELRNARRLERRLTAANIRPVHIRTARRRGHLVYQVRVGPVSDPARTARMSRALKRLGISPDYVAVD